MLCHRLFDLETLLPCNSGEALQTLTDPIKPTKTTLKQAERLASLSRLVFESENWRRTNIQTIHWHLCLCRVIFLKSIVCIDHVIHERESKLKCVAIFNISINLDICKILISKGYKDGIGSSTAIWRRKAGNIRRACSSMVVYWIYLGYHLWICQTIRQEFLDINKQRDGDTV